MLIVFCIFIADEAKKFPLGKGLALPATVVSVDYPPDEPFICVTVLGGCNCLFSGKHDAKRTSLRILVKHDLPPWVQATSPPPLKCRSSLGLVPALTTFASLVADVGRR